MGGQNTLARWDGPIRFLQPCPRCRRYTDRFYFTWDREKLAGAPICEGNALRVCARCHSSIAERNAEMARRRAMQEAQYRLANLDYFASASRASNPEYLRACEAMRRGMAAGPFSRPSE